MSDASAPNSFNDQLKALGLGYYRSDTLAFPVMAWNLRHTPLPIFSTDSIVADALKIFRPTVAVLTECPRYEFVRGIIEASQDFPYRFICGEGSGDQRIVLAYDVTRARLKERLATLDGPFVRPPLWAHFALVFPGRPEPVDVQVAGIHFKSVGGGHSMQRIKEAKALKDWLVGDSDKRDSDIVVLGDFNSSPHHQDLDILSKLEREGGISFAAVNGTNEVGAILRKIRKWPAPEYCRGETFLDSRFTVVGSYSNVARVKNIFGHINISELLSQRSSGPFSNWRETLPLNTQSGDFLPRLFGVHFIEFDPTAQVETAHV